MDDMEKRLARPTAVRQRGLGGSNREALEVLGANGGAEKRDRPFTGSAHRPSIGSSALCGAVGQFGPTP